MPFVVCDPVNVIPVRLFDLLRGRAHLTIKSTELIRLLFAMAVSEITPWLRFGFGRYFDKERFRPTFPFETDAVEYRIWNQVFVLLAQTADNMSKKGLECDTLEAFCMGPASSIVSENIRQSDAGH